MSLKYLTAIEAAAAIGVSKTTIHSFIDEGILPWHNIGEGRGRARVRICEDDLREFMESRRREGSVKEAS